MLRITTLEKHVSLLVLKGNKTLRYFKKSCFKTLEGPQAPEKQDYFDLAMAVEIESVLSNNEIMDLMEELEEIVDRICRQKRMRLEGQNPTVPKQPAVPGTSTDNNYFGAPPGPQGPMAIQVQQYNEDAQFYNF